MKGRWQAARARVLALAHGLAATRWFGPALRAAALGAGLIVLAAIGIAQASAGAGALPTVSGTPAASATHAPTEVPTSAASGQPAPPPTAMATSISAPPVSPMGGPQGAPTPEQPLVLNTATAEDLQRLPGIGPKKALAIVALRQRMGRFRQVEDLMKVKGIGRATVRRLRPIVRVEPAPPPDAGISPTA